MIVTPDLESFSAYGVEACYQFHGYALRDVAQVNVGGGITGQAMSYTSQTYGSWSIVYWIIPVKFGTTTMYERVVLYVQNDRQWGRRPGHCEDVRASPTWLARSARSDLPLIRNRAFLVAFARELIQARGAPLDVQRRTCRARGAACRHPPTPAHQGVVPSVSLTAN